MKSIPFVNVCVGLAVLACGGRTAVAADVFWCGAEGPDWHAAANWEDGAVPGVSDVAVFDPGQCAIGCWAFNVSNRVEVAGLRFAGLPRAVLGRGVGDGALAIGAGGVVVADGMVTLEMPLELGASQAWTVAEGAELLATGAMSLYGEPVLTKDGGGRVWLTGPGALAGRFRVAAGTLKTSRDAEAPVTEGLAVWLDAAATDTVVTNGAGEMTAWLSRVGGSAMAAVPGGGPRWVADALAGRPAARFSNASNQGMVMEAGYANTTNCATAFIVVQRRPEQKDNAGLLSIYRGGEQDYDQYHAGVFFHLPGAAPHRSVKGYRKSEDGGHAYFPFETPVCFMSRYDGVSHVIAQDNPFQRGTTGTHTNMFLPFDADRVVLANRAAPANGFNYPFNGDISEVLLYNRVLTEAEERHVFAYLNGKWGVAPSLEATLKKAAAHFDASQPETVATNTLGEVLAWTNLVSLENSELVPVTEGQNPLYVEGTIPAVRFDKNLTNALHMRPNWGYLNGSRTATLFAVVTPRGEQISYAGVASIGRLAGGTSDHGTAGCAAFLRLDNQNNEIWMGEQGGRSLGGAHVPPGRVSVVMSSFDNGMHAVCVNGALGRAPSMKDVTFEANYLRLGNRIAGNAGDGVFTFNGDVHEVLVFNCPLSEGEIAEITALLNEKWRGLDEIEDLLADAEVRFDASDEGSVTTNALGVVTALRNLNADSVAEIPAFGACDGPLYVDDAMNGLPVLRFRGALSNALLMTSGYANTNAALTAFAVVRCTGNSSTDAGLLTVVRHDMQDYRYANSAVVMFNRTGRYDGWAGYRDNEERAKINDVPFGAPFLLMSRFDGMKHTLMLNNGHSASVAMVGRFDADRLLLGARQLYGPDDVVEFRSFLSCDLAEMLVYNRVVTPTEADAIHAYLREKWYPEMLPDALPELLDTALVWLDASDAATVTAAPDGRVTAWANRNDGAAVFVPPPGCGGPALVTDNMNGRPVLRFDKDLAPQQMLWCDSGYALTTTAVTAVVLMRPREDLLNNGRLMATWRDTGPDFNSLDGATLLYYTAGNGGRWQTHHMNQSKSYCTNVLPETPTCLISRFDGYNHRIIKDGTELCSVETAVSAFNANRLAIGGRRSAQQNENEWYNGDVAEVLVFDYALTPGQYQTLMKYLTQKWLAPTPPEPWDAGKDIEVCADALLDTRGAAALALSGGDALYGAGTILGDVTVGDGGRLSATGPQLTIDGDLAMQGGARLAVDYSGGLRPLVFASGELTLADLNVLASAMEQVAGASTLTLLQGGTGWSDGDGNAPDPAGWTLTGGINGATFRLDPAAYRVNLKLSRGTILMLK